MECDKLISAAENYKQLYELDLHTPFHHAVSCVTSQQVRFSVGRQIRQELYRRAGFPLTPQAVLNANLAQIKGLTNARIVVITELCALALNTTEKEFLAQFSTINGVGIWTIKAVQLLTRKSTRIALYEDSYVRARLGEYLQKKCTIKDARLFFDSLPEESRSAVSYFFWRIRPEGVINLLRGISLGKTDFL